MVTTRNVSKRVKRIGLLGDVRKKKWSVQNAAKNWMRTTLRTYSFVEPLKGTMLMCARSVDTSLVSALMLDLGEEYSAA